MPAATKMQVSLAGLIELISQLICQKPKILPITASHPQPPGDIVSVTPIVSWNRVWPG
jgi:hypothetical protein